MASTSPSLEQNAQIEDVLAYLPVSTRRVYPKGYIIYDQADSPKRLYLALSGAVAISRTTEDTNEVLLAIVRREELFGAFFETPQQDERAVAIEETPSMSWIAADVEDLVMKKPRFGVGLLQVLAQRNDELTRRIQSLARDTIERRLAGSLLHLSKRLGTPAEDGVVRMMPLTHRMLSQYVGTSRELITLYMSRFRKQGYLTYSRQGIEVYSSALQTMVDASDGLGCGGDRSNHVAART